MKTTFLKFSMIILAVVSFISCKDVKENQTVEINTPEEVKQNERNLPDVADQAFVDGMTSKVWQNYLEIKMALANDDAGTVKDVAREMVKSFSSEREAMKEIAQKIANTDDIEVQRNLFAQFTEKAGPMFEDALSAGTIYQKFCPMAFNNQGAYWYAAVEEVSNPYFGEKMPNCGAVSKTIKK